MPLGPRACGSGIERGQAKILFRNEHDEVLNCTLWLWMVEIDVFFFCEFLGPPGWASFLIAKPTEVLWTGPYHFST